MKILFTLFSLSLMLLLFNCQNNTSSSPLNTTFSNQEIAEINQLINHADSLLILNTGATMDVAYRNHFGIVRDSLVGLGKYIPSNFCLTKKILSTDLQEEFFLNTKGQREKMNYTTKQKELVPFKSFEANYDGKYVAFLNTLTEENQFVKPFIKKYLSLLNTMGTIINPSATPLLLQKVDEVDFSNRDVRLIYIVHFLVMDCQQVAKATTIKS